MAYRQRIFLLFPVMGPILYIAKDVDGGIFGKGLVNFTSKACTYSVKMGLRFQAMFISDWELTSGGSQDAGEPHFFIRRARLIFNGLAHSPKLRYKFPSVLSNHDISGKSEFIGGTPRYSRDMLKRNFYKNFFTPEEKSHDDSQAQYTLTLSRWMVNHKLKIQTDHSYSEFAQNSTDGLLYRLQFEIHL